MRNKWNQKPNFAERRKFTHDKNYNLPIALEAKYFTAFDWLVKVFNERIKFRSYLASNRVTMIFSELQRIG